MRTYIVYQRADPLVSLSCLHSLVGELPYWRVTCPPLLYLFSGSSVCYG